MGGIASGSICFLLVLLDGNFELDFFFGLLVSPKSSTKGTTSMSAFSTSPILFWGLVVFGEFWIGTTSLTFCFVHFWKNLVDVCRPMCLEDCSQNPLWSFYFQSLLKQFFWAIVISLHLIVSL